jgi:ABC-type glutathione transport system ATPase component
MAKRKNIIAVVLVWIFKALWYVIKGIALALWFMLKSIGQGIAWLFRMATRKKASAPTPIGTTTEATETVPEPEQGKKKHNAIGTPLVAKKVKTGDFNEFSTRLASTSIIALIAGKRGSGKSTLGFRIMENVHASTKRPCYVLGVRADVLPNWITAIADVEQVANGGIVLVDEGALTYSSRDSMNKKNKELGKLLAIARHKDLTLLLITQNTGMIDKNVLNLCDTVMLKEGSLLQQSMEREAMKELYSKADKALDDLPKEQRISHTYIVDNDFEGLVQFTLPSFWNSAISKNRA